MSTLLLTVFEVIATVVFALSGATLGIRKGFDVYGVTVVGFLTALGGGVARDILLDQQPYTLGTTLFPALAIIASILLFVLRPSRLLKVTRLMSIFDAIGLGVVAALATSKALDVSTYPWLTCVILGIVTGSAGGMLRDVLAMEVPLVLRPGEPYATAALAGSLFVVGARDFTELSPEAGVWIGAAVTTCVRLVSIRYNISFPAARDG